MAIASFVLGIISMASAIVFDWWTFGVVGLITGVIAIILGALGKKDAAKAKFANLGFIFGIVGTALGVVFLIGCAIACAVAADAYGDAINSALDSYNW